MIRAILLVATLLAGATAQAQQIERFRASPQSPILSSALVPAGARVLWVSGMVPPVIDQAAPPQSVQAFGDTERQTIGVLQRIQTALEQAGFRMGDVVKMQVFLVGDPGLQGRMDFAGFGRGYARFFGTAEQPNVVARSTMQVAGLVNPGWLVEIEVVAARMD
jgi:enamine deaminase RidA (YjgF/YER057c/UK114 family)